jgi:cobalt-zinc-cadmium efflux system outer membrane protein
MRTRAWSVALVLSCMSATATAQVVLSESDALARLSAESPRVRAIRAAIDIARADVLAASRWPNPRVTFDRESVAGITEDMTMVAQALPVTGRRGLERDAADALLQAATSRNGDELRRARADLRLAFADLVVAQARERELTRARDHLRELAVILVRRETAGEAAGFDRLRAEREVLDVEADLLTATSDRARAQAAVASFFASGTEPSTIVAADSLVTAPIIPPVESLIERALASRGELLALGQEVEAARLSDRAAGRRAIPEPEIVAGTKSSNVAGGDIGSVFTVQAVIPLFDHGKAERALAVAKANQAEARADAFRLALRSQISGLRAAAVDRRTAAERYRASAGKTTQELERIAQVSYDAGERGILELLDAYRTGTAARVRQAVLDAAARQVEIELEFVSGWEMPS